LKFDKDALKQGPGRFLSSLVVALGVYLLVASVIFFNIHQIVAYDTRPVSRNIVEGILVPQSSINTVEIFNVDPLLTSSRSESVIEIRRNLAFLIFSSLFKENINGSMDNDLVESFIFKEGKDLSIKLKNNAYWHDGAQVTAHDVVFTLNLIKAIGQNGFYYGAVNGGEIDYKAANDFEVSISLSGTSGARPNVAYLHELTFPILPMRSLEGYSQAQINTLPTTPFGQAPIGSGKLKYKTNLGSEVVLEKNSGYYGKPVSFDSYTYRFYKNYDDIVRDFTLKNVDVFTRKDMVTEDELHNNLTAAGTNSTPTVLKNRRYVLYFNLESKDPNGSPFLRSLSLRDGLLHVVDRESLLKSVYNYGRLIYGPIDQTSWAFLPEVQTEQALNIQDFVKRVESQGYVKNGEYYEKNGTQLSITLTYLSGETRNNVALSLQSNLKAAGINLKLKVIGATDEDQNRTTTIAKQSGTSTGIDQFNDIVNNRSFEMLLTTVNHYQDPDVFTEWHSTMNVPPKLNLSGLNSKIVDNSLVEGRIEPDVEKRKAQYARFQRTFIQEVPAVYIMNPSVMTYISGRIQNANLQEINDIPYKYQSISEWVIK
jgi:peptide/nickel transport system substrate-binding protein